MPARPLPAFRLLDGLQLEAAEGRATGLLRALNVEQRDGLVAVRGGHSMIGRRAPSPSTGATFSNGGTWSGLTVTYIGFASIPVPDTRMTMHFQGTTQTQEASVTLEFYGEDDAWHPLNYAMPQKARGDVLFFNAAGAHPLDVVTPHGWKFTDPASLGSSKYWMRVTRSVAWDTPTSITAGGLDAYNGTPRDSRIFPIKSRNLDHCLMFSYKDGGTQWDVFDIDSVNNRGAFSNTTSLSVVGASGVAMAFLPATNEGLVSFGTALYRWTPDSALGTFAAFTPRSGSTAPAAYADIDLEAAIPAGLSFAVFGGRLFMANIPDDAQGLRWSAPNEFWDVWPSGNYASLASRGSGRILALVPLHGALFIFTETGVWRAVLADPTAGNESDLLIDLVEEVPCISDRAVVEVGGAVCFLSQDGVRIFSGSRGSRLITAPVRELFRRDSGHEYACLRPLHACAVWHPIENQYRFFYRSPGASENDTALVVDLDDFSCWLWGADLVVGSETSGSAGPVGQRDRGIRCEHAAWRASTRQVVVVDAYTMVASMDATGLDCDCPYAAHFETQTIGMGQSQEQILRGVNLVVGRENFASFDVSVIPDGNYAREDSRTVTVEADGLSTSVAVDSAAPGSVTLLNLQDSFAPVRWRGLCVGRNHRVKVKTRATTHRPFAVLSMEIDIAARGRR